MADLQVVETLRAHAGKMGRKNNFAKCKPALTLSTEQLTLCQNSTLSHVDSH
jgi:hypothetical protein